jgi:hypothetical protein
MKTLSRVCNGLYTLDHIAGNKSGTRHGTPLYLIRHTGHQSMKKYSVFSIIGILLAGASMPLNAAYCNLFNIGGGSTASEQFVTYDSLMDMLLEEERVDVFTPTSFARQKIIISASDGAFSWNACNPEGKSKASVQFVTNYPLSNILLEKNLIATITPTSPAHANTVGSEAGLISKLVVPEPSTLTLLGLGVAGLAFRRKNRS